MPNLTKSLVERAQPRDKEYFLWDDRLKGFGLRISPSGSKSFVFQYRSGGGRGGTNRRPRIGAFGTITATQARQIAEGWAAQVVQGQDPSAERQERRDAPRMTDLFQRYLSDHAVPHKKASSVEEDRRLIRMYLDPHFARKKVADLSRSEIDKFHKSLSDKPYRANRALALLSKALNLCEIWGWRHDGSNPCRHVKKYAERKRERFLSAQEINRLGDALTRAAKGELQYRKPGRISPYLVSPYAVAAIRLLIFTGARKGEILSLRWEHVNLAAGRLELPDSKSGAKFVYLPAPAQQLLSELERSDDNPFVIVGAKPGAHLVNLKDPWEAIRSAADLPEVRIHDLRHSFASVAAGGGMSLPVIGALLGHRNNSTTQRYAHLADDPLRAAAEAIGSRIEDALGPVPSVRKGTAS